MNSCSSVWLYSDIPNSTYNLSLSIFAVNTQEIASIDSKYLPDDLAQSDYNQF
jgi:hypothetical protein